MQTELLVEFSSLKPLLSGLLFFWASWIATKKILALSILGISAGETTFNSLQGHAETISTNPFVLQAATSAGIPVQHGSAMYPLIANVLMAVAMLMLVQAIKTYTRAKRMEMEAELHILETQNSPRIGYRSPDRR